MIYDLLFPYQRKIVDSAKEKDVAGLFMDTGTGKSYTMVGEGEKWGIMVREISQKDKCFMVLLTCGLKIKQISEYKKNNNDRTRYTCRNH